MDEKEMMRGILEVYNISAGLMSEALVDGRVDCQALLTATARDRVGLTERLVQACKEYVASHTVPFARDMWREMGWQLVRPERDKVLADYPLDRCAFGPNLPPWVPEEIPSRFELVPCTKEGPPHKIYLPELLRIVRYQKGCYAGQLQAEWFYKNRELIPAEWQGKLLTFPETLWLDKEDGSLLAPGLQYGQFAPEWELGFFDVRLGYTCNRYLVCRRYD